MSLLYISCILSILVSRLFICDSMLISRFWIISLSLLGILSQVDFLSSSFVWFGEHLCCSFTCCVFLCLFVLFILLYLRWPFCILPVCGSSFLWRFLSAGGLDVWLVKVSWLGELVSVFWWVELDFFSLECTEVPSNDF